MSESKVSFTLQFPALAVKHCSCQAVPPFAPIELAERAPALVFVVEHIQAVECDEDTERLPPLIPQPLAKTALRLV